MYVCPKLTGRVFDALAEEEEYVKLGMVGIEQKSMVKPVQHSLDSLNERPRFPA